MDVTIGMPAMTAKYITKNLTIQEENSRRSLLF
jgi:hypothetical protein